MNHPPFTKYKATLQNENAQTVLEIIITTINKFNLTVEDAQNVLNLALAAMQTGTLTEIKIPTMDDIATKTNYRECAGPLITNSHLQGA